MQLVSTVAPGTMSFLAYYFVAVRPNVCVYDVDGGVHQTSKGHSGHMGAESATRQQNDSMTKTTPRTCSLMQRHLLSTDSHLNQLRKQARHSKMAQITWQPANKPPRVVTHQHTLPLPGLL